MPNDNVEIKYSVTGTKEAASQVEQVNKAVEKTGEAAKKIQPATETIGKDFGNIGTSGEAAHKSVDDLGRVLMGTSATVRQYGDLIGFTHKEANQLANAASAAVPAVGLLGASFAVPTLLLATAGYIGISKAMEAVKEKAAAAKVEVAELQKISDVSGKAEADRRSKESTASGAILTEVESALAAAGLDSKDAAKVSFSAIEAARKSFVLPEKGLAEAVRGIAETGKISTQEELERRLQTGEVRPNGQDLSGLSARELDALSRSSLVQGLVGQRAATLDGSLVAKTTNEAADQASSAIFSRTKRGLDVTRASDELDAFGKLYPAIRDEFSENERQRKELSGSAGGTDALRQGKTQRAIDREIFIERQRDQLLRRAQDAEAVLEGRAEYSPSLVPIDTPQGRANPTTINIAHHGPVYYNQPDPWGTTGRGTSPERDRD